MKAPAQPRPRPALELSLQQPNGIHRALVSRSFVSRTLRAALRSAARITVRIVDEQEGRALNAGYRGKDYATNVLTFDYEQGHQSDEAVNADLVLCAEVVAREATDMGIPLQQHYAHLLVHGALHAQGFDHEDDDEAREMEALETALLKSLGWPDPYATSREAAQPAARKSRAASRAK